MHKPPRNEKGLSAFTLPAHIHVCACVCRLHIKNRCNLYSVPVPSFVRIADASDLWRFPWSQATNPKGVYFIHTKYHMIRGVILRTQYTKSPVTHDKLSSSHWVGTPSRAFSPSPGGRCERIGRRLPHHKSFLRIVLRRATRSTARGRNGGNVLENHPRNLT